MPVSPVHNHPLWRNLVLLLILLATLATAAYLTAHRPRRTPQAVFELKTVGRPVLIHNGERYLLSRPYGSDASYRQDPERIAQSDRARAALAVIRQPVPTFALLSGIAEAMGKVRFPGFDYRSDHVNLPDGASLHLWVFEVPYAYSNRVLLYYRQHTGFVLLDDRVLPAALPVSGVTASATTITYTDGDGTALLSLPWPEVSTSPVPRRR